MDALKYQSGFGNHFATEAIADALPKRQNSPQKNPLGLYAEQLSGSAFTAPNHKTLRSWLYRIQPSVKQNDFQLYNNQPFVIEHPNKTAFAPNPLRWDPWPFPNASTHFVHGMHKIAYNGSTISKDGACIYVYSCNKNMENDFFSNQDGELLIVPEQGELLIRSEFGSLFLQPEEILVMPRGIKFQVQLVHEKTTARGYILENYGSPLVLPERGPIGANCLANERDFLYPVANFEDKKMSGHLISKFMESLWLSELDYSPLDVVAWHGNYAPYKYNLKQFAAVNSVTFDHPDPSIFSVLTSPGTQAGVANIDFVIFPERWQVAEHTFRPPYFHRNTMSEFMGLIKGYYDAKPEGFKPGGMSIHNCMTPHGPDANSFDIAARMQLKPSYIKNTLAFMFESQYFWLPTDTAMQADCLQKSYRQCWQGLPRAKI